MASQDFQVQLTEFLPKMRKWALALTRNGVAADDLVQDVAIRTLIASETFIPGTNFSAWVHRIMINQFISDGRKNRFESDDKLPEVAVAPVQQEATDVRQLGLAFQRLSDEQKVAIRCIVFDERSYDDVAGEMGCPVGTLKSRVHRARLTLRSEMFGETQAALSDPLPA